MLLQMFSGLCSPYSSGLFISTKQKLITMTKVVVSTLIKPELDLGMLYL